MTESASVDESRDVRRLHRSRAARLDRDRRLAARGGRGVEIAGCARIRRAIRRDDDRAQPEREDHLTRGRVLPGVPGLQPVAVGAQIFVEVPAVEVDQVVAALDDLLRHRVERPLRLRPIRLAGVEAVHALAVDGIDVGDLLLERRRVEERNQDDRAGDLRRVELFDQLLDRDDRGVLGAVRAGDQREHRTGLRPVDDGDRDVEPRVGAGGDREDSGRLLAPACGGGADGERRWLREGGRAERGREDGPGEYSRPPRQFASRPCGSRCRPSRSGPRPSAG